MTDPRKQYKLPVFSHVTKIRCERCGGTNVRRTSTKYNGLIKYWKCQDCGENAKTVGREI